MFILISISIIKKNSISVVVNDIETSCLVGGVPAKFIKKVQ